MKHEVILSEIQKTLEDQIFEDLIRKFFNIGYFHMGKVSVKILGIPQGANLSPLMSKIYLHLMDEYVLKYKENFKRGKRRRRKPLGRSLAWKRVNLAQEGVPRKMLNDPKFLGLNYVRYADDFIIGVIGGKEQCGTIRKELGE